MVCLLQIFSGGGFFPSIDRRSFVVDALGNSMKKALFVLITIAILTSFVGIAASFALSNYSFLVYRKHSISELDKLEKSTGDGHIGTQLAAIEDPNAKPIKSKLQLRRLHPYCGFKTQPGVYGVIGKKPRKKTKSKKGNTLFRAMLNGHQFRINKLGYRSPSIKRAKEKGTIRIAMIGGSSAWLGSNNSNTIIAQLAHIFQRDGHKVEYINAGIVSAVSSQELAVLVHELIDLDIDLVISLDGFNDIHALTHVHGRIGWPAIKRKGRPQYYPLPPPEPAIELRKLDAVVRHYLNVVDKMAAVSKTFNIEYIAILQPILERIEIKDASYRTKQVPLVAFYQAVISAFEKRNRNRRHRAHYLSMANLIDPDMFWDAVHFDDTGNQIVANTLYRYMNERGILSRLTQNPK